MKKSKNEIDILRLKIIKNDLEIAQDEYSAGLAELNEILTEFKEKLVDNQKEKYQQFFFGDNPKKDKNKTNKSVSNGTDIEISSTPKKNKKGKNKSLPDWVKKIYRKIMQSTHPDKYINFPVESIKEKYLKIYRDTVDAAEEHDIGVILLCAYEANIDINNSESTKYIEKSYTSKTKEIKNIKKLLAYQWYHVPDNMRETVLKNYLTQLGFAFSEEQIKKASKRKRPTRKAGTKPPKINRVNKKKIK